MIRLELPWPPSVNHYWKPRARLPSIKELVSAPKDPRALYHWLSKRVRGYKYMPKEAERWREEVVTIVRPKINTGLRGQLHCRLELFPPNSRCDFDNYNKPIFDALEHAGVYQNDRQIRACLIRMRPIVPGGRVRLTIANIRERI